MENNKEIYYSALASRDPRFDGIFFVGVTSTGIYCRPVCTARKPKIENCLFFHTAAAAEKAAFRPCLKCRPELAPGFAPIDDGRRIAHRIAYEIEDGAFGEHQGLEDIAETFELSARQIRRIVHNEFGVSPMELVLTRRLLLSKQLLTETNLPITEIAYASGFSSLRRFNDAFLKSYGMAPGRLRKQANGAVEIPATSEPLALQLAYRVPFDWSGLLAFLKVRALPGIETVSDTSYSRTINIGSHEGWIQVHNNADKQALMVQFAHSLTPILPSLLKRVRALFDLDARPEVITNRLGANEELADAIEAHPGLRIPGSMNGYETAIRAILGQQITVKAATTLAGRFLQAFGTPIETSIAELTLLFPSPDQIAALPPDEIAQHGIIRQRARSIIELSKEVARGALRLTPGAPPQETIERLMALPGIGPWTANYIALRVLQWPDAFPAGDVVIRKKLGGVTAAEAEKRSESWRPWRSYATLYIWNS